MVSTVKARPNFYEMLGLSPAASMVDVEQAFAREMSMFRARPLGATTALGVAFETLRDPARRRAYDVSLGLNAKPRAAEWTVPARKPLVTRLAQPAPAPAAPKTPPQPGGPGDDRLAAFLAASLREPVNPQSRPTPPDPVAQTQARSEAPARSAPRPSRGAGSVSAMLLSPDEEWAEDRRIHWKWPAVALGGLVVAVGLFGATAGLWAGRGEEQQPAEPAVTMPLPSPQAHANAGATVPASPEIALAAPPIVQMPSAARTKRTESATQSAPPPAAEAPQTAAAEVEEVALPASKAEQPPVEQATAADEAAPVVTPARMPLPNATIARTIEKIGYACGAVGSITAAESAGVFKVTCTSGQSYQARSVRGRYHFRRWGSH